MARLVMELLKMPTTRTCKIFTTNYDSLDPTQTFTIVLVSGQNPNQQVYALTITDRSAFVAFYLNNLSTDEKFLNYKAFFDSGRDENYFGYGINNNHSASENEKNFLRFIGKNTGLKVHKANADLSQWNPLKLNASGNVEPEPACN